MNLMRTSISPTQGKEDLIRSLSKKKRATSHSSKRKADTRAKMCDRELRGSRGDETSAKRYQGPEPWSCKPHVNPKLERLKQIEQENMYLRKAPVYRQPKFALKNKDVVDEEHADVLNALKDLLIQHKEAELQQLVQKKRLALSKSLFRGTQELYQTKLAHVQKEKDDEGQKPKEGAKDLKSDIGRQVQIAI